MQQHINVGQMKRNIVEFGFGPNQMVRMIIIIIIIIIEFV